MQKRWKYPIKIMIPAMFNKIAGRASPVKVGLQIIKECNLQCSHCYLQDDDETPAESLTLQEIFIIITDLKKMNISVLALTGGEPLLHPDLTKIISCSARKRILTGVATNGTMLTAKIAASHIEAGLSWYHFSVDGSNEEINKILRSDNFFSKVCRALQIASDAGIDVIATTVVVTENMQDLEDIVKLLISYNVKIWSPTIIVPCGRGKDYLKKRHFTRGEVRSIYKNIYRLSKKYSRDISVFPMDAQIYYPFILEADGSSFVKKMMYHFMGGCSVLKGETLYINFDGTLKPCAYFMGNIPNVNVKSESVIEIFRKDPFLASLQEPKNLKGKCRECEYIFCCGGCRARGWALSNDPFAEDAYCIYK